MVALLDIPAEMFVVRLRREARVTVALVAPGPAHTDLAAGGGTAGVLTAVQLVREVSTVVLAVAEQLGLQAEAVLTAELSRVTAPGLAGLREDGVADRPVLVTSSRAVSHSVTELGPGHTAPALGTGEEVAGTGEVVAARGLLTPVTAVVVSVTVKHGQHTLPVTALNLLRPALSLALRLVSRDGGLPPLLLILQAVVFPVAEPGPGDAVVVVGAAEVVADWALLAGLRVLTQVRLLVRAVTAVPGAVTRPLRVDALLAGLAEEHLRPAEVAVAAVHLVLSARTVAVSVTDPASTQQILLSHHFSFFVLLESELELYLC